MSREIIAALDMAEELGEDPDQQTDEQEDGEETDSGQSDEVREGEQQAEAAESQETRDSDAESEQAMDDAAEIDSDDVPDDLDGQGHPRGRGAVASAAAVRLAAPMTTSTRSTPTSSTR